MDGSVATFVFTDIEGSSRLWEQEPAKMQVALAAHDRLAHETVESRHGRVLKSTGDGFCAVFDDPLAALDAALAFQVGLAAPAGADKLALRARCGIHTGVAQQRDNDYFGNTLNRASRIMSAAHGGQVLLSQAVVDLVRGRLPEAISLRDLGSVRLRDLASPERVYQLQHASLRGDFPALRSLEATPNNLPLQATSFVGRDRELAEARQALRRTRLLTLTGTGGIGKTRLSLQLAADALDDYPDGAWFVELAPIGDERLVAQAVANAVGVKDAPPTPLAELLVRAMAERRMLLLLDNCEHVLGACATLAEHLLRGVPGLRIVASSREPLRIAGEAVFPVPALGVPEAGAASDAGSYSDAPAVRLFAERASAVLPSFRLGDDNARTIGEICRHLDGIPLAIELAAARVRALPVDAIAARLGDRFRLLTSGSRTALPRQQTLRSLIDWSHDLLTEAERVLFRRLAVFAGGWTLESAESVCAGGGVAEADVFELLASLVDKSLVVADLAGGRYRLLETIRQYAGDKLASSGEEAALRERHLAFHLAFAESVAGRLNGPDEADLLARLDVEHENLLAAHAWCGTSPEHAHQGLRLVNAAKSYWFSRGLLPMGKRLMLEALNRPGAQRRDLERCIALFGAGQFCSFAGEYDEAVAHLEESLSVAREIDDRRRIAAALQPLSLAELGRGRLDVALGYADEAVTLARAFDDPHQLAAALNAAAQLCRVRGDLAAAEPLYDQVIALGRRLANANLVAVGLLNVAMVYVLRGAYGGARLALQEVLAIASDMHSMPIGQSALEVAAGFASMLGDAAVAVRLFGAAEANMHLTGIYRDPADDSFLQPLIAQARAALGEAASAAAEREGRAAGYEAALAEVRDWLDRVPAVRPDVAA